MTQETKRVNIEREPLSERETNELVTNDSLGTTDTADSTGLDKDRAGAEPAIDHQPGRSHRANP